MRVRETFVVSGTILALACGTAQAPAPEDGRRRYRQDLDLLRANVQVVELTDDEGRARVAVVPAYQGRVMTSTARGADGWSLGWINEELISSWETLPHINPYGGEDRFWFGPEGGQFAVFFEQGDPFDLEHWQTPPVVDTEPFELMAANSTRAVFRRRDSLTNYSGFTFDLQIDRSIRLLSPPDVASHFQLQDPEGVDVVAFESENQVTNTGSEPWVKETGLLSIWILGMFPPSERATVVIPFIPGPEDERGPVVNDAYFGKVPPDRLVIEEERLFFRADGRHRSKIGISPPPGPPHRRQLRPGARGPDPGPAHPPRGSPRLRQLHVAAAGGALRRRRGELLQRRAPGARGQAPRALLRARVLVAGPGAGAGGVARPHPPDRTLPGERGGPGPHRPGRPGGGDRGDRGEVRADRDLRRRLTPATCGGARSGAEGRTGVGPASSPRPGNRLRGESTGDRRSPGPPGAGPPRGAAPLSRAESVACSERG